MILGKSLIYNIILTVDIEVNLSVRSRNVVPYVRISQDMTKTVTEEVALGDIEGNGSGLSSNTCHRNRIVRSLYCVHTRTVMRHGTVRRADNRAGHGSH